MLTLMCDWPRTRLRLVPFSVRSPVALRHPAALLTFAAPTRALACVETDAVTVFHDAPQVVAAYRAKMRHLDAVALSVEQSRGVFAAWAGTYERKAG